MMKRYKFCVEPIIGDLKESGEFEIDPAAHSIITFEKAGVFNYWLDKPSGLVNFLFEIARTDKEKATAVAYLDYLELLRGGFAIFIQDELILLENVEQVIKPHSKLVMEQLK